MKAIHLIKKLWAKIKLRFFLKVGQNKFKVKVTRPKIMLWRERFSRKEYTYQIWKLRLEHFMSYDQS